MPSYAFEGCSSLERIELKSADPLLTFALWYSNLPYRINGEWSTDEEIRRVQVVVPEEAKENCIREWQYCFAGQTDYEELRGTVKWDLYIESFQAPTDAEVLAECGKRLLEAENRIRGLLRMETVNRLTFPPEELKDLPAEQAGDSPEEPLEEKKEAVTEGTTDPEEESALTGEAGENPASGEESADGNSQNASSGTEEDRTGNTADTENAGTGAAAEGGSEEESGAAVTEAAESSDGEFGTEAGNGNTESSAEEERVEVCK